jgi:hypothetical protein
MQEITITHDFDCDEDTHWNRCFLNDAFNRKVYLDTLEFPVWRVIEHKDTDDAFTWRVDIRPLLKNIPGPVMRVMGDRFGYVEDGTFDKKTKIYKFRTIPSLMAEKVDIHGEVFVETLGAKKIRRTVKVHVEVKVFAIGALIEQSTVDQLRTGYDQASAFMQHYLTELA